MRRYGRSFTEMLALYPAVTNELDTLRMVVSGRSIARYGDGEFKMAAHNVAIKPQRQDLELSQRLREILFDSGECLVGIPNIKDVMASPLVLETKKDFWAGQVRFHSLLKSRRSYVSSLISRPDSAAWINTDEYWALVESLWVGQDITVVGGSGKSIKPEDLDGAGEVTHIQCAPQHAWSDYDDILKRIGTPKRALICLGPTATVLAVELCRRGVHAVDLGHLAMFLRKRKRGEPMWTEREAEPVEAVA